MADYTFTQATELHEVRDRLAPGPGLPGLTEAVIQRLKAEYWITTVGGLVQALTASGPATRLDTVLELDREALTSFLGRVTALLPPAAFEALSTPTPRVLGALGVDGSSTTLSAFRAEAIYKSDLPSRVSHVDAVGPIMDQGGRGTCVACGFTTVNEWLHAKDAAIRDLSPQHLYYLCKKHDGHPGSGTFPDLAAKLLLEFGQCTGTTWQYQRHHDPENEGQGPPPPQATAEALGYQVPQAGFVQNYRLDHIKHLLAGFEAENGPVRGRPLTIGVEVYPSFMGAEVRRTGRIPMPLPGERRLGGHLMAIVGYCDGDAPGGGYFIIHNSWGVQWASENPDGPGHAHLPYSYLKEHGDSVWLLLQKNEIGLLEDSPVEQPRLAAIPKPKIFLGHHRDGPIALPLEGMCRHIACVGSTGSGKTWLAKRICEQVLAHRIPVIAVDPQGDLASMARLLEPDAVAHIGAEPAMRERLAADIEPVIFTPASDAGIPLCVSPLHAATHRNLANDSLGHQRYLHLLAELVTKQLQGLPHARIAFFQSAVAKCLRHAVAKGGIHRLDELAALLFALPVDLERQIRAILPERDFELLRRSFLVLLDSPSRHVLDYGMPLDIDLLVGRVANPQAKTRLSIIYLNTLASQSARESFVGLLAERLHQWMQANPAPDPKVPQLLFVLDEIGTFIPNPTQKKPICKDILVSLFKQARKYGVSCLGAAQSPGDFDYRALGQSNTMCIGRLKAAQDYRKVARLLADGGADGIDENVVAALKPGEFVLWAPDSTDKPRLFHAATSVFAPDTVAETEIAGLVAPVVRDRMTCQEDWRMNPRTEDTLAALGAPDATTGHHSASDLPSGCCAMDKGADASQESAAKDATTYANDDRRVPQTSAPANSDHHIVRILRSSRCALKPGEIGEAMLEAGTSPPSRARLARVLRRLVASATIARARHGRGYRYFLPKQYDPRSDVFEQVLYPRECAVDEARVRALLTGRKLRWWPLGSPTLIHALARRHVGLWRLDFATGGSWWQQLTGTRQSRQLFVETASGALAVSSGKYIGFVTGDEIHRASLDEEPFVEAEWELRFPGDLGAAATNLTSLSEGREKALVSARALGIDNVSVTLAWVPCWFASVEQNSTRRELVIEAIGGRELRLPNSAIPAIRRRGGLRRERVRRVTASR